MTFPNEDFEKWLTDMQSDITEDGKIGRFELAHQIEGEHADRIDIWRNEGDTKRVPHELAVEIYSTAERDSKSRTTGQPQRYIVFAYRADSEIPEKQYGFLIKSASFLTRLGEDSEPPTDKGVIAHYMRHDENVHRLFMAAGDSLIGKLSSELDRERACRVKAEEQNWSMAEKYQSLLDREHERRIAEAKELMRARRIDELLGAATAVLPLFAARFLAPKETEPAKQLEAPMDPKDEAIRRLLKNLSPAEVTGIAGSLSTANQFALMEIHRAFSTGGSDPAVIAARQLAVRKFLKALNEREVSGVFASLSETNRAELMSLYMQYSAIEEAEQQQKPEILRS